MLESSFSTHFPIIFPSFSLWKHLQTAIKCWPLLPNFYHSSEPAPVVHPSGRRSRRAASKLPGPGLAPAIFPWNEWGLPVEMFPQRKHRKLIPPSLTNLLGFSWLIYVNAYWYLKDFSEVSKGKVAKVTKPNGKSRVVPLWQELVSWTLHKHLTNLTWQNWNQGLFRYCTKTRQKV